MCYERWMERRAERERAEGRRLWDLFDRETTAEPPRPVSEEPESEPEAPERETATTPR